jgi:ribonuclease HI
MEKYYVVWTGRKRGVFASWASCSRSVFKFPGAKYRSFKTLVAARAAYAHGPIAKAAPLWTTAKPGPVLPCIAVDASCRGPPGPTEFRGVMLLTPVAPAGEVIFQSPVYKMGTNNIGEFLAIVRALMWLEQTNQDMAIYSDSAVAIAWIKNGRASSQMEGVSEDLKDELLKAEGWLVIHANTITRIHKWDTRAWGEIPADYGRK